MRLLLAWRPSSVDSMRFICCYICNSFSLDPGCCVPGVGASVVGVKSRGDAWCCEKVISRLAARQETGLHTQSLRTGTAP